MPFRRIKIDNPRTDKLIQWTYFVVAPVLLGVVIAALFFSITTNNSLKGVGGRIQQLSEDNKQLSEQNKQLSEQNKNLNKQTQNVVQQNREYIRCLADTFAAYTRNQQPIVDSNLDSCNITNGTLRSSSANSNASGQAPSGNGVSSGGSSSNHTPTGSEMQSNTSQENNTPSSSPQPVKVLGIPVCVPFTKMCVVN